VNCSTKNKSGDSCPVVLKIRARAPPVHNSSALDCREWSPCELDSPLPAWGQWYYVLVERYLSDADVYFRIGVRVTGDGPSPDSNTCFLSPLSCGGGVCVSADSAKSHTSVRADKRM
jgi:hypothetical protein